MIIPTRKGGTPHKEFICGRCGKKRKLGVWWNDKYGTICKKCDKELSEMDKDYFLKSEVQKAFYNTDGKIIGAESIKDVLDRMNDSGITSVKKLSLADSERECIEYGLGIPHYIK